MQPLVLLLASISSLSLTIQVFMALKCKSGVVSWLVGWFVGWLVCWLVGLLVCLER